MLGSWESADGSHFTAPPLYRFVMLTRIFYTSIACQMEIKNNCFLYSTLHSLYVCKRDNMYLICGPRSARSSRTVYSKI